MNFLKYPRIRLIFVFVFLSFALLYQFYFKRKTTRYIPVKNAIYVSPSGGEITHSRKKYQTIPLQEALDKAIAPAAIFLFPGRYEGTWQLKNKKANEKQPISIQSAHDAIISGSEACLTISDSEWIFVEFLEFQDCQGDTALQIHQSQNIYANELSFKKTTNAISISGLTSENIVIEKNQIKDSDSFVKAHSPAGNLVLRKNQIQKVKTAFHLIGQLQPLKNIQIQENILEKAEDSFLKTQGSLLNLWVSKNQVFSANHIFFFDETRGGKFYLFSNVGKARSPSSSIFKWNSQQSSFNNPVYIFHNTWFFEQKYIAAQSPNQLLRHYNNVLQANSSSGEVISPQSWHSSFRFDYDLINFPKPNFLLKEAWKNAVSGEAKFISLQERNFSQRSESPGIDSGISLKFFSWESQFYGKAPDLGAFEGGSFVKGPAYHKL